MIIHTCPECSQRDDQLRVPFQQAAASLDLSSVAHWVELTMTLNELNRSVGQGDAYPFAPPPPAVTKFAAVYDRFPHRP